MEVKVCYRNNDVEPRHEPEREKGEKGGEVQETYR